MTINRSPFPLLGGALAFAAAFAAIADQQETLIDFAQQDNQRIVELTRGGVYRLTGENQAAQLLVNSGEEKITLILDNLTLSNDFGAAIYIASSGDAKVVLAANSQNTLADSPRQDYLDTQPAQNAPLHAKSDLRIEGQPGAQLRLIGRFKDGIVSKDDLDIRNASITVEAVDDAIYGKDSIDIRDSAITVSAGDDGLKSDNQAREDKGYIYIDNSDIQLDVQDDAITAPNRVNLRASTINIQHSNEGIESRNISILSGDVYIRSLDDAINIADSNPQEQAGLMDRLRPQRGRKQLVDGMVSILGGRVHIKSDGDGFDSNGSALMSGGELFIEGPSSNADGYIDVDGTFDLTGGELLAFGSAGMAQTPSDSSTQPIIQVNLERSYPAEATLLISQLDGDYRYEKTLPSDFASFTFSAPDLTLGASYAVRINGDLITELTLDGIITRFGNTGRQRRH